MDIIFYVFVFCLGISFDYLLNKWLTRKSKSSGTIYVSHDREKTLYSLELSDYPESIEFKKQVVFKVKSIEDTLEDAIDKSL